MTQYKIEFLPANIIIKKGETDQAKNAIEGIMNKYASQGFELAQVAKISVTEKPGCLGSLLAIFSPSFGERIIDYTIFVFRKEQ